MKLSVVVLNFRTPDLTIKCLTSLEGELEPDDRIVVVDNASNDGSPERIQNEIDHRGWGDRVHLVRSTVNCGFAAGNNLGIRVHRADACLLLNSDTFVRPGAVAALRALMLESPETGIVVPLLEHGFGAVPRFAAYRAPRPIGELIRAAQTGPITRLLRNYDTTISKDGSTPDWVGFACVLIRRTLIEEIGLLDEGYFMYFEDVEYCLRAKAAGWRIRCHRDAVVVHHDHGSAPVSHLPKKLSRMPRYYYESRARYFAEYSGITGLWMANMYWCMGWCIARLRQLISNRRVSHRELELVDIWINALSPYHRSATEG